MLTSPFFGGCGVALQAFPNEVLARTDVPSPSVNGKPIPPQSSDGDLALLTARLTESCYLPHHLSRPAWLQCPLPGLNDTNLQSRKLKQIVPGSQPH